MEYLGDPALCSMLKIRLDTATVIPCLLLGRGFLRVVDGEFLSEKR